MLDPNQNKDFIFDKIVEFSPAQAIVFAQTNHHYATRFFDRNKPILSELRWLLKHVSLGEWLRAEHYWLAAPALLSSRGTIYHPNRYYFAGKIDIPFDHHPGTYQYIDRTAWQITVMNEAYAEAHKMGQLMTEEEKQRQFAEIFPDGVIIKYDWDLEEGARLLQVLFDEVVKDECLKWDNLDNMSEATRTALNQLRVYAKPTNKHEKGLAFDARLYLTALEMYDADSGERLGYHSARSKFWSIRVEEWLAGCLGMSYLMQHSRGNGSKKINREECKIKDKTWYFPFRRDEQSIPGRHFYISYNGDDEYSGRRLPGKCGVGNCSCHLFTSDFRSLCEAKEQERIEFARPFMREEPSLKFSKQA